jgi:hypothetical protein
LTAGGLLRYWQERLIAPRPGVGRCNELTRGATYPAADELGGGAAADIAASP